MTKPIALAADHGGFELKEAVKAHLDELGLEYIDFGTHSTASVDYPDMALPACDAVVSGQCSKALLFCGTGIGISIAANKHKGIRAACCSAFSARATAICSSSRACSQAASRSAFSRRRAIIWRSQANSRVW